MNLINEEIKNFAVVILAAGSSHRMDFPKPFLLWNDKLTFIEKIIQEYKNYGCEHIITVLNTGGLDFYYQKKYDFLNDINIIINKHPEYERFYSVKSGLKALNKKIPCFIQNVDNPFVNLKILNELYKNKINKGYVVPCFLNKGGHPVLLGENIIEPILSEKKNENLKVVLSKFERKNVSVKDEKILININTQEDYDKYFEKINKYKAEQELPFIQVFLVV